MHGMNMFPRRSHPDLPQDAAYSPDRDIAYVIPALVSQLLPRSMEKANVPSWLKGHLDANKLTEADLQKGVAALQASIDACNKAGVPDMKEAMKLGGFWDLPDATKIPPLMGLALLAISAYFEGVRMATLGDRPHKILVVSGAMKDVLAAGVEATRKDPWHARFLRSRRGK